MGASDDISGAVASVFMPEPASSATLQAVLQPWAEVAEPLHKRIGQLLDPEPTQEILWIGGGAARSILWLARRFECHIVAMDPDPHSAERGAALARSSGLSPRASFQSAVLPELPFEEKVFDAVVVHALSLLGEDVETIIGEAARVGRPMATVLLLVPSWAADPPEADRVALGRLGIVPRLIVEWKAVCRAADLVELTAEEAAADGRWLASGWVGTMLRAWRIARSRGLVLVLGRDVRTLRRLAHRRVLSLSIIKGTRWQHE